MPLHTDLRPKNLDEFAGNEETIKVLRNLLSRERSKIPHSYLIFGPRGCGKTTLAQIIARELGCNLDHDFVELNAASFRGIDTARDILKRVQFKPLVSECRVWFLDECHQLTKDAQEALLKVVEEPPEHVYFIFSTTDPQDLKPTLKDRCIQLKVEPLDEEECVLFLKKVCRKIRKKIPVSVLEKIAEVSEGRPRTSLVLLERILELDDEEEMMKAVSATEDELEAEVIELCRILFKQASWKKVASILKKLEKEDPETIRRIILKYCSTVLLNEDNPRAFEVMYNFSEPFYNTGRAGLIMSCYACFLKE